MTIAIVYGRASNDPKEQRISVDRQLRNGRAKAAELWPDAEIREFRDDGITAAKSGVRRPDFEDMVRLIRGTPRGELAGLVVLEQARLTRQGERSWDDLVVILTAAGLTTVETLRTGPVSVAPGSRLHGRLLAVFDQEEVERMKVRATDLHRDLFAQGRPNGRPPYGLRRILDDAGRPCWVHDDDEAEVVRRIFAEHAEGHALSAIAARLTAEGIPTAASKWKVRKREPLTTAWRPSSVRSVLTSPAMAGLRSHTDEAGVLHLKKGRWEGIVPVKVWEDAQRQLGQPRQVQAANGETYRVRTQPKATSRRYLLSGGRRRGDVYGVLRCGRCGWPLVAQTQGRRNGERIPAYQCSPAKTDDAACGGVSISPAELVEATVVAAVQAELARSPKLAALLNATDDERIAELREQQAQAQQTMLDAAAMRGSRYLDQPSFEAMYGPAKADFEAAVAALGALADGTNLPSSTDVIERWDDLTLTKQRAVVEHLIERIVVAPSRTGRPGYDEDRLSDPVWRA